MVSCTVGWRGQWPQPLRGTETGRHLITELLSSAVGGLFPGPVGVLLEQRPTKARIREFNLQVPNQQWFCPFYLLVSGDIWLTHWGRRCPLTMVGMKGSVTAHILTAPHANWRARPIPLPTSASDFLFSLWGELPFIYFVDFVSVSICETVTSKKAEVWSIIPLMLKIRPAKY